MTPKIIIKFVGNSCDWMSVRWGNDAELMAKAKKVINEAETKAEVVANLTEAGFEVVEVPND